MGKDFKYQVKINNRKSVQEIIAVMERRQKEMYEPIGTIQYMNDYIKKQIDKENEIVKGYVFEEIRKFGINVDKEELIKALNYDRQQYEKGYRDGLNADKWIPCSKELPEEDKHVLCQTEIGYMKEAYLHNNLWHIVDSIRVELDYMVAWQPLPEPYRNNEESDNDE